MPTTETMYAEYQSGLSMAAIGKKHGIATSTVQLRFKRAQLKTRALTEAHKLAYATGRHTPHVMEGENHPQWKDGTARRGYRKQVQKEYCEVCEATMNLCIHHRDLDHYNNNPENLQVLCVSCHLSLHKKLWWIAKKAGRTTPKSTAKSHW